MKTTSYDENVFKAKNLFQISKLFHILAAADADSHVVETIYSRLRDLI